MAAEEVVVTPQALDNAASDTDAVAGQIEGQLNDLHTYLRPLVATWTGQASTDWQSLQQKWDTSADDLNTVLREIASALRQSAETYTSGENTNAQMWQG